MYLSNFVIRLNPNVFPATEAGTNLFFVSN